MELLGLKDKQKIDKLAGCQYGLQIVRPVRRRFGHHLLEDTELRNSVRQFEKHWEGELTSSESKTGQKLDKLCGDNLQSKILTQR